MYLYDIGIASALYNNSNVEPKKKCAQNKNAKESETSERTRSNYDDAG